MEGEYGWVADPRSARALLAGLINAFIGQARSTENQMSGNPMPVQTVDATPSGIKLFSKVVFMKQGRRFGLSAEQKLDVWRRWKAGQTLHEIGAPLARSIRPFVAWCRVTVGLLRQYGGARSSRSRCGSARKSLAGWLPVRRSVRSPNA